MRVPKTGKQIGTDGQTKNSIAVMNLNFLKFFLIGPSFNNNCLSCLAEKSQ